MPLELALVTSVADFGLIVELDAISWTPYNPQLKHFRPAIADPVLARSTQKAKYIRKWESRKEGKTFWVKVTDTDTNEILGFARWAINEMKGGEEKIQATWYPEGSVERKFAERFINGLWGFLEKRVTRPHMGTVFLHSLIQASNTDIYL